MKKSEELFNKIKITEDMLDYNVANILIGDFNKTYDPYTKINRKNLAYDEKYKNTILGIYFRHPYILKKLYEPGYSGPLLKISIDKYIKNNLNSLILPDDDELVIYFRLGDHVINWYGGEITYKNNIFFDYKKLIDKKIKNNNFKKITIVTNLAFCGTKKHKKIITDDIKKSYFYKIFQEKNSFTLNKANLNINRKVFIPILDEITNLYKDYEIDIVSNYNPDYDICYLYKNGFLGDYRNSWYGIFNYNG
tara:strand:+ start:10562 stop:11311 length:750 start_codon:yes stop_codon:yes gene_type:complete